MVTIIPLVTKTIGTLSKDMKKRLDKLYIRRRIDINATAL